ncbi:MAG: flagellar hook-length control protein FliK [Phycisphaerales bacterium]|nr:flagellar hook-length control protein FliK [Phycisphaerales bacterium]
MGAQLLLIDTIRSATFESAPRPIKSSAEPTGTFDDYLDEAQSADAASPSDEPAEASDSSDERETDDGQGKTTDETEEQVVRTAQSDEQIVEAIVVQRPEEDSSRTPEVVSGNDRLKAGTQESSKPVDFAKSSGDADPQPKQDTGDSAQRTPAKTSEVFAAPSEPTEAISKSKELETAERIDVPVVREKALRAQEAVSTQPRRDDSQVQKVTRHVEQGDALPKDQPVVKTQAKTTEQVTQSEGEEDGPRPLVQRETVYQRKVNDSIAARREGSANGQSVGNEPKKSLVPDPTAVSADDLLKPPEKGALLSEVKSASLSEGRGDAPATAIARFLVAGRSSAATVTDVVPNAPISAGATGESAGVSPVSSTNLVGELLTARVESQDSVEGAVRVLNASGGSGRYQVTMQLDPPELGQLKLQIRMHQQGMTLHVDTETQGVARLIESRLSELRDALSAHGIRIDRADVVVKSPDTGETDLQQRDQHAPNSDAQQSKAEEHGADSSGHRQNRMMDDPGHDPDRAGGFEEFDAGDEEDIQFNEATHVNNTSTTESSLDLVV